jgi:hypothetical protein
MRSKRLMDEMVEKIEEFEDGGGIYRVSQPEALLLSVSPDYTA